MTSFLYNDRLFTLSADTDPQNDPTFPLQPDQFAGLSVDDLLAVLGEGLQKTPDLAERHPRFILSICHLLNARAEINAVRIIGDEDAGGPGVSVRCGKVPEPSLIVLAELRDRGALNLPVVDEVIWDQLS